jgi:flagellar basal-body rod protein FlgB
LFDDVTSVALRSAVAGLAARQRAISQNIANIETPGYRAQRVSFEDDLARAVADGDSPDVAPTAATSLEPTRQDGNNVNLDTETMSSVDTTLRYQLALKAVDSEFSVLRAAMRTS